MVKRARLRKVKFVLTKKGAVAIAGVEGELFKPIDEREKDVFLADKLIRGVK